MSHGETHFTFDYFHKHSDKLIYEGDAHVPLENSFLRLTKTDSAGNVPAQYSVGRVLYSEPVQFWETGVQALFETTIKFFITPPESGDPADGIAFFVAPVHPPIGADGGSLGIFDASGTASHVFAVEFDTYPNRDWDPDYSHIGINIESTTSKNVKPFPRDALLEKVSAHIKYTPDNKKISVDAKTNSGAHFKVEYDCDLKAVFRNHKQVQVGISAATGEQVAIHDILYWSFTSTLVSDGTTA